MYLPGKPKAGVEARAGAGARVGIGALKTARLGVKMPLPSM